MEKYLKIKDEMKELHAKITSEENRESDIDKYFELKEQLMRCKNVFE